MNLKTVEAADIKLNTFWREIILPDDAFVIDFSPTPEELQRLADEIYLSKQAANWRGLEEWLQAESANASSRR